MASFSVEKVRSPHDAHLRQPGPEVEGEAEKFDFDFALELETEFEAVFDVAAEPETELEAVFSLEMELGGETVTVCSHGSSEFNNFLRFPVRVRAWT